MHFRFVVELDNSFVEPYFFKKSRNISLSFAYERLRYLQSLLI